MASNTQGLEARYLSRFSGLKPQTGLSLKNIDSAGNVTEHLTQARASLKTQEKNIGSLLATASELVAGIDTMQAMLGHSFVRNMPQPNQDIKSSSCKQLGYVQLALRFFSSGVIHFMEQMTEAEQRIERLENLLATMAQYDEETDLIGEMVSLDLETLEPGIKASLENTVNEKPASPPATPTKPLLPTKNTVRGNSKK